MITTGCPQSLIGPFTARGLQTIYTGENDNVNDEVEDQPEPDVTKLGVVTIESDLLPSPRSYLRGLSDDTKDECYDYCEPVRDKGNTTLAFVVKDGIMLAVDHAPSSNYASGDLVENVIDLEPRVLVTVSGVENTRSFLTKMKEKYVCEHEAVKGRKPVKLVSKWVSEYLRLHPDKDLSAKMMVAGWDVKSKEPCVYTVDGSLRGCKGKYFGATGSGWRIARCYNKISLREMSDDEALDYAKHTIETIACRLANYRREGQLNAETGGYISGYYLGAEKWERVFHDGPFNE